MPKAKHFKAAAYVHNQWFAGRGQPPLLKSVWDELVEQEDHDPQLAAALRHSLRSPLKKYKPGHFAALATRNGRCVPAA